MPMTKTDSVILNTTENDGYAPSFFFFLMVFVDKCDTFLQTVWLWQINTILVQKQKEPLHLWDFFYISKKIGDNL